MSSSRRAFLINGARVAGGLAVMSCVPAAAPGPSSSVPANVPVSRDLVIAAASEILTGQPFNDGGGGAYGY